MIDLSNLRFKWGPHPGRINKNGRRTFIAFTSCDDTPRYRLAAEISGIVV